MNVAISDAFGDIELGKEIDFLATGRKEVAQNVKMILTTVIWELPLDRLFGFNTKVVDLPFPVAYHLVSQEAFQAVHEREPRFIVKKVVFSGTTIDGSAKIAVTGDIDLNAQ
jgi:phage baseplate assembly protein W